MIDLALYFKMKIETADRSKMKEILRKIEMYNRDSSFNIDFYLCVLIYNLNDKDDVYEQATNLLKEIDDKRLKRDILFHPMN